MFEPDLTSRDVLRMATVNGCTQAVRHPRGHHATQPRRRTGGDRRGRRIPGLTPRQLRHRRGRRRGWGPHRDLTGRGPGGPGDDDAGVLERLVGRLDQV